MVVLNPRGHVVIYYLLINVDVMLFLANWQVLSLTRGKCGYYWVNTKGGAQGAHTISFFITIQLKNCVLQYLI